MAELKKSRKLKNLYGFHVIITSLSQQSTNIDSTNLLHLL
jgi:hypothetical protein